MKLYLDDKRPAPGGWQLAKNFNEAILWLALEDVTHLSLDHDLGTEKTGYDVITWLEAAIAYGYMNKSPIITIHSANPVGRQRMEQVIESIEKLLTNNQ